MFIEVSLKGDYWHMFFFKWLLTYACLILGPGLLLGHGLLLGASPDPFFLLHVCMYNYFCKALTWSVILSFSACLNKCYPPSVFWGQIILTWWSFLLLQLAFLVLFLPLHKENIMMKKTSILLMVCLEMVLKVLDYTIVEREYACLDRHFKAFHSIVLK